MRLKITLKPENTIVEVNSEDTLETIISDQLYTYALTRNGQPVGLPNQTFQTLGIVNGDRLYRVMSPDFSLQNFCEEIVKNLKEISTGNIINVTSKNAILEFSVQSVELSLLISLNTKKELNLILTIEDDTININTKMSYQGLSEVILQLKTRLSNFTNISRKNIKNNFYHRFKNLPIFFYKNSHSRPLTSSKHSHHQNLQALGP